MSSMPKWLKISGIIILFGIGVGTYWSSVRVPQPSAIGHTADHHKGEMPKAAEIVSKAGEPPFVEESTVPGSAPEGMVWVPGGQFSMGTEEPGFPDTRPIHRVILKGFWMDQTEVTNAQFERFVKATGYITIAERKPRPEDLPGGSSRKLDCRIDSFLAAQQSCTAQ